MFGLRILVLFSLLCLAGDMTTMAGAAESAIEERPNILFIFADDQCYETIAALGHPEVETPNLDRLVQQGTTFTHAYNMGSWSGAVCVASRTMLNTGRFLWHAHAVREQLGAERAANRLWSEMFREAGYATYMTGKWHLGLDAKSCFEVTRHIRPGMPNQTPAGYDRPAADGSDPWSPFDPQFGGFWKGGRHWSEVLADDAEDFIQLAAQDERPFFMYLAFNAPHDPRQSPREFVERYTTSEVHIPTNFLPEYPFKDAIGCSPSLRDERLAPFPRTEHAVQVHRQEYYALITHMDNQIGRILSALEASGERDRTYIVFTADHGLAVGRHGLFGKQNLYDHSVRVPFIMVGPRIAAGESISTPIYLQDIVPTSLELANIPIPGHVEFKSLLPLIESSTHSHYDSIYGAYLELQRSITKSGYKLILYPRISRPRLYHLATDPDEMFDLAGEAAYEPVIRHLMVELLKRQAEVGDTLDLLASFADWLE